MDPSPQSPSLATLLNVPLEIKITDIGANPIDGSPPYQPLMKAGIARIVGFEPAPDALAKLNQQKGPHETYLPHAVGDGRRHTLNFCRAPGMTSLLEPNPEVLNLFHGFPEWGTVVSREEIQTVSLDKIPETAGTDLIKIDIQGGELMAFKHAKSRLADALVIHTEVEFLPMYKKQPLFSDVEQFLRQQGFMLHRFYPQPVTRTIRPLMVNNNIYSGLSQLFWSDALFMRDITRLERLSDRQLLAMATILHDCYQSMDVALFLLLEHDRRRQSRYGERYLQQITTPPPGNP